MDEGSDGVVFDRLLRLYRRYLGEPERLSDVYVGFGLFFAGVSLALVGLLVFLWSANLSPGEGPYWQLRQFAIAAAMLGLPAFLTSVVVLLPVDRRAVYAGAVGGVICLGAVAFFVANYPGNWNTGGPDASATGVSVYGLGLVVSTAAVGAGLVSSYVERIDATVDSGGEAGGSDDATGGGESTAGRTVTDEQVRADIDEALSSEEITWGGVTARETRQVTIRTDDEEIDRSSFDTARATENRATGDAVENAVDGLRKLRGGDAATATGEATDDQAAALQDLRQRRAREAEEGERPTLDRLRDRLGF